MWSDSTPVRTVRRTVAPAVIAAGLLIGLPDPAPAGASPFSGRYCAGETKITVSTTGAIRAKIGLQTLFTGRIGTDGTIALTYTIGSISGDMWMRGSGGGGKGTPVTVYGVAALDADGNLYGVVEWIDGNPVEFFWTRCD